MSTRQAFTGYTEVDTPARLTIATSSITMATLDDDEEVYCYKDFTSNYFSGDYEHTFKFIATAQTGSEICYLWGLSNDNSQTIGKQITANIDLHTLAWNNGEFVLIERNATVSTSDTTSGASLNTYYYIRVVRDENVGTYGTLYAYIYTDDQYTELFDTLVVTLTENKDFQYVIMASGKGDGGGSTAFSGVISDMAMDSYAYTLGNMRTRIRDSLNESTATFWTDDEINAAINDGYRTIAEIGNAVQHIDALTTTNGTRTVSYNGYRVGYVEYKPTSGTRRGLYKTTELRLGRLPLNGTSPQWWFDNNGKIGIEPIPDATYNLDVYLYDYVTDLTVDSQIPEIPPAFRPLIIIFALYRLYIKEKSIQPAMMCYSMFMNELTHAALDFSYLMQDTKQDYIFAEAR